MSVFSSSASEIANTGGKSRVVMTILKKKSKEGTKNSFKKLTFELFLLFWFYPERIFTFGNTEIIKSTYYSSTHPHI